MHSGLGSSGHRSTEICSNVLTPKVIHLAKEKSGSVDTKLGLRLKFHEISVRDHLKDPNTTFVENVRMEPHFFLCHVSKAREMDSKQLHIHVARRDGKELLPEHMDALCDFYDEAILIGREDGMNCPT
jgi:hypothetical protein